MHVVADVLFQGVLYSLGQKCSLIYRVLYFGINDDEL